MIKESDLKTESGVYLITNSFNNKIYIGSSCNIKKRYNEHRNDCVNKSYKRKNSKSKLHNAFSKYEPSNFIFSVICYIDCYLLIEEILIKLIKPEYNTSLIFNGLLKPNFGKKFSKEWIDKIKKTKPHSKETLEEMSMLNKENGNLIKATSNTGEVLFFKTWVATCEYFKCSAYISTRLKFGKYKFEVLKTQKRKIKVLKNGVDFKEFNSTLKCDRFFNLWRGCTSNSLKHKKGIYGDLLFNYL